VQEAKIDFLNIFFSLKTIRMILMAKDESKIMKQHSTHTHI
jgi:hypothetical protein